MNMPIIIFSLLISTHTAFANLYDSPGNKEIFESLGPLVLEKISQNLEERHRESLKIENFPLTILDWQLVTDPYSRDRYMNKHIIGTITNSSKKKISEIKIEFTVYDEEGNQIAIVSNTYYDFNPGGIWRFQIPVTDDVTRAELKGLYILPSQNSSESTSNREEIRKEIKESARFTS